MAKVLLLRILIVAEHASERFGGEAILPLHWFREMRKLGHEVWLLVHARTRGELEKLLGAEADRVAYVPDLWLHRFLLRLGAFLPHRLHPFMTGWLMHLVTQIQQRRVARSLIKEHRIEVVHEPIPVSPRLPSLMSGLGVPVVIGPMNGGMSYPPGFRHLDKFLERAMFPLARMSSRFFNWCIPGKRRASLLLVANERTRRALPAGVCKNVLTLCENAVQLEEWPSPSARPNRARVRFLFVGRLIDWKGADLLLEAFSALIRRGHLAELWIVGEGPERESLRGLAHRLGVTEHVCFLGWVPHALIATTFADCDVFVLPSLFDCGGAVVLEAMASGLPVIVSRWGGPADYVEPGLGITVRVDSRQIMLSALTDAMCALASSPELRDQYGRAARAAVCAKHTWECRAEVLASALNECLRRETAVLG